MQHHLGFHRIVFFYLLTTLVVFSFENSSASSLFRKVSSFKEDSTAHADTNLIHAIQLQELVVSAFNREQRLSQIPGSISLLTSVQLEQQSSLNLVQTLNLSSGVFAHNGTFNTSRISIRGIGARTPYATGKIRAYFENIPLTNGSGISSVEYIDPAITNQIEIIKSPASSAYGAGLGGTILLRSKEAENFVPVLSHHLQVGAFGWINNTTAFETKRKKFFTRMVYNNGSYDGYRENNSHRRQSLSTVGGVVLSDRTNLRMVLMLNRMKAYIPSSIDSNSYYNKPTSAATNWLKTNGFEDGRRGIAGLSVHHIFRSSILFDASLFSIFSDESEVRPFDLFDESRRLFGYRLKTSRKFAAEKLVFVLTSGTEMFLEGVIFRNFQNKDGFGAKGNPISENEEFIRSVDFFVQGDVDLKRANLSLGLNAHTSDNKYTNFSYILAKKTNGRYSNGWVLSPRLSANYLLWSNNHLFASISHGFSPPSLSETLHSDGTINIDIKPEKSFTYEVGLRGRIFKDIGWYDFSFFIMDVTDLLVTERVGEDAWVGRNAGRSLHRGAEVEAQFFFIKENLFLHASPAFLSALDLKLSWTVNDFRFKEFMDQNQDLKGNLLPGIPNQAFSLVLHVQNRHSLYSNLTFRAVGKMPMNDLNTKFTEPYQLLDIMVGIKKSFNKVLLNAYINVNNVFNEKYAAMILVNAPAFGTQSPRYYYPGLPVYLTAGIKINWFY